MLLGHSVGQYAAACVAGVFSLANGARLLAERGRLFGDLPAGGRMAAVFADPERVERIALLDTQAGPDSAETAARRRGFIEQTRIGRFHGIHPTLLPQLVHPSRVGDESITRPLLYMAGEVGGDGFVRQQ